MDNIQKTRDKPQGVGFFFLLASIKKVEKNPTPPGVYSEKPLYSIGCFVQIRFDAISIQKKRSVAFFSPLDPAMIASHQGVPNARGDIYASYFNAMY